MHQENRKTFLVINFLRLIHSEIIIKEFTLAHHKKNEDQFNRLQGRRHFSKEMTNKKETIPMPTSARRPSTMSSTMPVEFPQNSTVGQQRQQISELQYDKFPNPQSFLVWKIRFKNQVTTCSDFPSDTVLWTNEVEVVDSLDEFKSSRSSLEEQNALKEGRFPRGRQIAFMVYDYFRETGAHDTVRDYADLFSATLHDDNVQEFDTMGRCSTICQKFHPMMSWKVCTNEEHVSPRNSKPHENCTTWRFIRRYRCPITQN